MPQPSPPTSNLCSTKTAADPPDMSSMFQVMTTSKKAKEGKTQAHPVKLTLEELYHGCLKKVVFLRKKLDTDGSVETEERELVIDVRPGLPDGTRFVFEGFVSSCKAAMSCTAYGCNWKHVP